MSQRDQRGRVAGVNQQRGMIAVSVADVGLTVAEVIGAGEFERGDEVVGELTSLGGETWWNARTKQHVDVFVEDIYASPEHARRLLWPDGR